MNQKLLALLAGLMLALPARAHVKWFSMMADCAATPITTFDIISLPLFAGLALAAFAAMFAVAAIDHRLSLADNRGTRFAARLDRDAAGLVGPFLRIGVAIYFVAVAAYFQGAPIILTIDLKTQATWVPLLQLAIAATVLFRRSALFAALGIAALFVYAASQYGVFHMLDYPFFLGLSAFLALDSIHGQKGLRQGLGILRVTVGISLLWCGVEKWLYPGWTMELLQSDLRVLLKTGLSPVIIVMGAGFVEFGLAFVLIFGRLGSQIAAAVLLSVMISAIPVVGIVDLIGHLPILVVLIILAATRNPIGRKPTDSFRSSGDFDTAIFFMVSIPGFIAAYYLSHETAYGALAKMAWTEALVAGSLLALLLLQVVRMAPDTFRQLYRLDSLDGQGARPVSDRSPS